MFGAKIKPRDELLLSTTRLCVCFSSIVTHASPIKWTYFLVESDFKIGNPMYVQTYTGLVVVSLNKKHYHRSLTLVGLREKRLGKEIQAFVKTTTTRPKNRDAIWTDTNNWPSAALSWLWGDLSRYTVSITRHEN